jgi:hypothetical protein
MRTPCRCRQCQGRQTLARHPDDYERVPACRNCGAKRWRVDGWMLRRKTAGQSCRCGGGGHYVNAKSGYGWPHRIGSPHCLRRFDDLTGLPIIRSARIPF